MRFFSTPRLSSSRTTLEATYECVDFSAQGIGENDTTAISIDFVTLTMKNENISRQGKTGRDADFDQDNETHPVATGAGAVGGGLAGAAIGTAVGGPVGTAVGAVIGAVAVEPVVTH